MQVRYFGTLFGVLAVAISGCGGGSGSSNLPAPGAANAPLTQPASSAGEAQSDSRYLAGAAPVPASSDMLYVGNVGSNSITVYHHDAQGNVAPVRFIAGSKTQITKPGQLSEDAAGELYVANGPASILVFAPQANGNVAPIRVIAGPLTGIHNIEAMTVDQTTGKIFVVDTIAQYPGLSGTSELLRFAPNASGDTAPLARSATNSIPVPMQIASDSTGGNIMESHIGGVSGSYNLGFGVTTVPKQFPNGVTLPAVYATDYYPSSGIVDDPATKTYLATGQSGINRFAENTVGVGANQYGPATFAPAMVSTITSAASCGQLALGYLRNIYAICGSAVDVFTHDSSGNVAPLRVLSGGATKLNRPYGIFEGK
jgi:hypothetical protein